MMRNALIRTGPVRVGLARTAATRAVLTRAALALLLLASACKGGKGGAESAVQDVVEGRRLYLTYGCVGCHGVSGGGGMGKPILDDQWIFGSDDATLFKLIRGEVPKQTMPSAIGKVLTDDQINQVIRYVRYIYTGDPTKITWEVPPKVPDELMHAAVSTGDPVAAGKVLFVSACVNCHGEAGKGDGPGAVALNPKPRNLTDGGYIAQLGDRHLFELISRGGIAVNKSVQMPAFPLNAPDINNIIAYVRTLSGGGPVVQTSGKL